jgi:hypothetical protein
MGSLKVKIQPKHDRSNTGNKLTFSSHSRAKARERLEEEKRKIEEKYGEYKEFMTTSIHQKMFGDGENETKESDPAEKIVRVKTDAEDEELRNQEWDDYGPKLDNDSFFPGIYPALNHQYEGWNYEEEDLSRTSLNVKKELEKREYKPWNDRDLDQLDLGPVYDERKNQDNQEKKPGFFKRSLRTTHKTPLKSFNRQKETMKLIASIAGAIALGSLFGYLLLMLLLYGGWFKDETNHPDNATSENQIVNREVIPATDVDLDPSLGGTAKSGSLMVPDRTYYAIQGGVFSSEETGKEALEQMKQKGMPALLFNDTTYRLFLGVGYKKEDIEDIATYFQNQGTEIYAKEYTIPGGTLEIPNTDVKQMETLNNYFIHGTYLLEKTAAWSGDGIVGKVSISDSEWNKFKNTHQEFLKESQIVMNSLSEEQKKWIDNMTTDMNQAISGMVAYIKQPDTNYLLQSQQALLNYFNGYREFLNSAGIDVSIP